ncbi:MAG: hypothetical protein AB7U35_02685 [Sphingobium sp.]
MSDSLDYSLLKMLAVRPRAWRLHEVGNAPSDGPHEDRMSEAPDASGLMAKTPWRSIPLKVSNDRADMVFEIYRVTANPAIEPDGPVEEWRWRFCTMLGDVQAFSGSYPSARACREAVDALRYTAGGARIQQLAET